MLFVPVTCVYIAVAELLVERPEEREPAKCKFGVAWHGSEWHATLRRQASE